MCRCVCYTGVVCISVHIYVHARYRVCICAHVRTVCSFSDGELGWGVQLVYEGTCCLAWGVNFDKRRDSGIVCVILIASGSVCGCKCV